MQPQVWQVVVAGAVVGQVSLRALGDELVVVDVGLADPRHTDVLRALLDCRAIADGATAVVLEVAEGAGAPAALLAADGFDVASLRLRLPLDADLPGEDRVRLAPMGSEAYAGYRDELAEGYARERARSGESPERAREVMRTQLAQLLPDGLESPGQHLFTAWAGSDVVGHLWIALRPTGAFVYDVEVVEEQRRRGHGAALMRAGALWARERGAGVLGLNVFGHNTAARAMYAALGYTGVDTTYRRVVGTPAASAGPTQSSAGPTG